MEGALLDDSPLSNYLEGKGEGEQSWHEPNVEETASLSFAPPTSPPIRSLVSTDRKAHHPQRLLKKADTRTRFSLQVTQACKHILHHILGWNQDLGFLEEFRYLIVASQLLNDRDKRLSAKSQSLPLPLHVKQEELFEQEGPTSQVTLVGVLFTICIDLVFVTLLRRTILSEWSEWSALQLVSNITILGFSLLVTHLAIRNEKLRSIRGEAKNIAPTFLRSLHEADMLINTSITTIQEVELVSRGYNINIPMPPASRLEKDGSIMHCASLRLALSKMLRSLYRAILDASQDLSQFAVALDLEKYFEIYEISHIDLEGWTNGSDAADNEYAPAQTLDELRSLSRKIFHSRRLLLCTLLALNAEGGRMGLAAWSSAAFAMSSISAMIDQASSDLSNTIDENAHGPPTSPTTQVPVSPNSQRMKNKLRTMLDLSQHVRSAQAKTHLFTVELEAALKEKRIAAAHDDLMHQYDTIERDLQSLCQDWQSKRKTLRSMFDESGGWPSSDKRLSVPQSPTSSLGGTTATEESPKETPKHINESMQSESPSSARSSISDKQVFEAVALPHQKSIFSREERIAKRKEEQANAAQSREKAQASVHMIKELQSVMQRRPKNE